MKPKSKTQTQPQRVQIGRQVRQLPQSTASPEGLLRMHLVKALDRTDALRAQLLKEREEHKAQLAKQKADERHDQLFYIGTERARLAGLDEPAQSRFVARLRAAKPVTAADVYRTVKELLHEFGASANPPAPTGQSLLSQQLPPPSHESTGARPLIGAEAEHAKRDPQRAEIVQAAREHAEQERLRRERYRENLRKQGLQDPAVFSPCG